MRRCVLCGQQLRCADSIKNAECGMCHSFASRMLRPPSFYIGASRRLNIQQRLLRQQCWDILRSLR